MSNDGGFDLFKIVFVTTEDGHHLCAMFVSWIFWLPFVPVAYILGRQGSCVGCISFLSLLLDKDMHVRIGPCMVGLSFRHDLFLSLLWFWDYVLDSVGVVLPLVGSPQTEFTNRLEMRMEMVCRQ